MPQRNPSSFSHLSSFLPDASPALQELNDGRILKLLRHDLDQQLLRHIAVYAVSETRIAVFVPNQALATRLRFELTAIRAKVKKRLMPRLQQVRLVVQPAQAAPGSKARVRNPVSQETVTQMEAASSHIKDPELSRALKQLARHLKVSGQ